MNRKLILATFAAGLFSAAAQASPVAIVQANSEEAGKFSSLNKIAAKMPDKGKAHLAVDAAGAPQALLLPAGGDASVRDQLLKYGAALNGDGSLTMPVTTPKGAQLEILVAADGTASVQ